MKIDPAVGTLQTYLSFFDWVGQKMDSRGNRTSFARLIIFSAVLLCNPISLGVFAGVIRMQSLQSEGRDAAREETYLTSCQRYQEFNNWERWTSFYGWKMGWCDQYLGRM